MNCSLVTLSDSQLTHILDALAQEQPMTHETLSDMAQIDRELMRRLKLTMQDLDELQSAQAVREAGFQAGTA
jgi:hypothetical protein